MNRAKNFGLSTHNACITRLLLCRLIPNLPLNAVNPKKSRMPNVANRVDAIVMPYSNLLLLFLKETAKILTYVKYGMTLYFYIYIRQIKWHITYQEYHLMNL